MKLEVVVVQAPPPPRVEVVYAPPGPGFIWVKGYWSWRGGRHVWIAGRYERPPRGHHHWVEPRWERRGGRYVFIEGRWGRCAAGQSAAPGVGAVGSAEPGAWAVPTGGAQAKRIALGENLFRVPAAPASALPLPLCKPPHPHP